MGAIAEHAMVSLTSWMSVLVREALSCWRGPFWLRVYLCHACSGQEIEGGNAPGQMEHNKEHAEAIACLLRVDAAPDFERDGTVGGRARLEHQPVLIGMWLGGPRVLAGETTHSGERCRPRQTPPHVEDAWLRACEIAMSRAEEGCAAAAPDPEAVEGVAVVCGEPPARLHPQADSHSPLN
jgi:hypothetical protein